LTKVILFNKPYKVLSQFRESDNRLTLSSFFNDPSLRIAGRLDYDSEGLLVLSDDGRLIQKITNPGFTLEKTYHAQVEGEPDLKALEKLRQGLVLKDGKTRPARVKLIEEPGGLWPRDPPIRFRASIPTSWLELTITEGRNRQVRRMTAAVNFPTLRLIRVRVGDWSLGELKPGESTKAIG
jgi:23S rRNA pseudouridine2457 synthase